jgi:hypothetical protein
MRELEKTAVQAAHADEESSQYFLVAFFLELFLSSFFFPVFRFAAAFIEALTVTSQAKYFPPGSSPSPQHEHWKLSQHPIHDTMQRSQHIHLTEDIWFFIYGSLRPSSALVEQGEKPLRLRC